jgi:hypothetical protein
MNECDELFPATESRKKKRGSGFRFSSKKVLDRSRLKRLAKARGCEVTSVTRTLSYPSLIPSEVCFSDFHGSARTSCDSPVLVSIAESEEERKGTSNIDHIKDCEYPKTASSFNWFTLCFGFRHNCVSYSILSSTSSVFPSVSISISWFCIWPPRI